jgi:hypothetical protein
MLYTAGYIIRRRPAGMPGDAGNVIAGIGGDSLS